MTLNFRRANERDLAAAVAVLTAAFADYEVYREKFRPLFASEQSYREFLNGLHTVMVRATLRHHICLLAEGDDGRLRAVASVHRIGHRPVGLLTFLRAGMWKLWRYARQLRAFQRVFDVGSREAKEANAVPSFYLELLAVAPDGQGQGLGGVFLREGLDGLAREEKIGRITLTTNTESNCRFYERNGFRQLSVREVAGVPVWTLEKLLANLRPH